MNPQNKENLKRFILQYIKQYPKQILLNSALKGNYSEEDFDQVYEEVEQEEKSKLSVIKEQPAPIPERQETKKPNCLIAVRLPLELIEQINATGYNKSQLIRESLKHYFKEHFKKNE